MRPHAANSTKNECLRRSRRSSVAAAVESGRAGLLENLYQTGHMSTVVQQGLAGVAGLTWDAGRPNSCAETASTRPEQLSAVVRLYALVPERLTGGRIGRFVWGS